MKKKIADRWVKALRSGKYKQGIGYLNKDNKFCCLGVLCDLATKSKSINIQTKFDTNTKSIYNENIISDHRIFCYYDKELALLPQKVKEWAGMRNINGVFESNNKTEYCLTELNDNGKSFKQIANIIEKNYKNI